MQGEIIRKSTLRGVTTSPLDFTSSQTANKSKQKEIEHHAQVYETFTYET